MIGCVTEKERKKQKDNSTTDQYKKWRLRNRAQYLKRRKGKKRERLQSAT